MDTRERYLAFAEVEAAGSSATYERLALAVADSPAVLDLLDELPPLKRQPNLVFAAARILGAPMSDPQGFGVFVEANWDEVAAIIRTRATQTNEAARTGTILPVIAAIEGPVALIEVGCSAGLCLYPDRYAISYDGRPPLVPGSPVTIDVATTGPVPVLERAASDVCGLASAVDLEPHRSCFAATSRTPSMPRSRSSPTGPHRSCSTRRSCTTSVRRAGVDSPPNSTATTAWCGSPTRPPGVVDGLTTNLQPPATATRAAYFVIGRGHRAVGDRRHARQLDQLGLTTARTSPDLALVRWALVVDPPPMIPTSTSRATNLLAAASSTRRFTQHPPGGPQ